MVLCSKGVSLSLRRSKMLSVFGILVVTASPAAVSGYNLLHEVDAGDKKMAELQKMEELQNVTGLQLLNDFEWRPAAPLPPPPPPPMQKVTSYGSGGHGPFPPSAPPSRRRSASRLLRFGAVLAAAARAAARAAGERKVGQLLQYTAAIQLALLADAATEYVWPSTVRRLLEPYGPSSECPTPHMLMLVCRAGTHASGNDGFRDFQSLHAASPQCRGSRPTVASNRGAHVPARTTSNDSYGVTAQWAVCSSHTG